MERRVLQAVALVCAVSAVLTVYWVDEQNNIQQHLDPPEKVTTVPAGKIGELAGARWTVMKRADAPPPAGAARQGDGAVTELRLAVGVRPESETAAKTVASTGIVYRLVDDEGRRWSAADTRTRQPQAGVAMLVTLRAKVPLALADSLQLEIQAPETTRKEGDPLLSLRFEH